MKKVFFLLNFLFWIVTLFSQWTTSGSDIYYNGGNVGIGISTPSEKLHVAGNIKLGYSIGGTGFGIEWFSSNWGNGFGHKIYNTAPTGITDLRIASRHNSTSWTDIMTFTSDGNIGIGTMNPTQKFDINTVTRFGAPSSTNANIIIQGSAGIYNAFWITGSNYQLKIGGVDSTEPSSGAVNIDYLGKVMIGTTNNYGYKLAVNGSAIFTSAKVKLYSNWPDFVFHRKYYLLPLNKLEKFIKQNHHLPEIPSANEVKINEGIDLGDISSKLLQKVEELTLYLIELKKENDQLRKEIQKISRRK